MADEPIDEQSYLSGVKVVDIGDLRVSRGKTRRPASVCRHRRLSYDPQERRVWCRDCEKDVEAFDAFTGLVEQFNGALEALRRREKAIAEAEAFQVRSVAAKNIDQAWRSRNMVPACPSCGHGLFPEDFRGSPAMLGKDFAQARRGKRTR